MSVTASAPGKIVLCGEYAVLWDAPAVCMAVNRRAVATVAQSGDGDCHLETPGFDGMGPYRVLDALLAAYRDAIAEQLDERGAGLAEWVAQRVAERSEDESSVGEGSGAGSPA